jgi:hypothetical protein
VSVNESCVVFGPERNLVGTLAMPERRTDLPAFVFFNPGFTGRIGPTRLYVRLARALAGIGFPSLRFDLSGLGDSRRPVNPGDVEPHLADIRRGIDEVLRLSGSSRCILVGLCSATDQCLKVAGIDDRVIGSVLLDAFAYRTPRALRVHFWNRVRKTLLSGNLFATAWRMLHRRLRPEAEPAAAANDIWLELRPKPPAPVFSSWLAGALRNDAGVLMVYTSYSVGYHNYRDQIYDAHPEIPRQADLRVCRLPHADHVFSRVEWQQDLLDIIVDWLNRARAK